ncbi:hypothetical protein BJY04DRAFT_215240 [Aspergillus karnatakaensis]|uniref:uncharacterized protein n=1 Tax=Aspergillus karnatakaensis TaxID=1810916 RepID=UPI003CCE1A8F
MAHGYSRLPGELSALPKSRNRSQTTIVGLPPTPSPQKKRASSFYPPRASDCLDDTNPDPFYLEHSLTNTGTWDSCQQGFRNARSEDDAQQQYYMLSVVKPATDLPVPPAAPRIIRPQAIIDRSTLSAVEIEHQLGLQQTGAQLWADSQTEATPDLTPSSSFSSNYSAAIYPDPVVKATEQLNLLSKQTRNYPASRAYPYSSTPQNRSQVTLPTEPSSPNRDVKPHCALPTASSETITMPSRQDPPSLRGKPLPSLPAVSRPGTANPTKKQPPSRLIIEPSMISPPSLINPVTLEPHRSHFDQALFIPANECPSPVPSPGPPSPSIDRQPTAFSTRPSTSTTSGMLPEQSVWESDSDGEDSRSSRKPMDTLKKVRSRVQLRVAKSTPKLQLNTNQSNNGALEKFPTTPDPPIQERCSSPLKGALQSRTGRNFLRPTAQQTLRLVAPSTTSLVHSRSRRNSAKSQNYGIDRSTAAAAIQAKSRRRQRSTSPETSLSAEREKMCTFCREERSDRTIHHSLTLARPPLYKRVWESLRVLGCHSDIKPPRPRKAM